jgi:Mg2+ and Co2+ transporter CorA
LLPTAWQIPDYFHSRLGDRVGRQRAMVQDGHLLLVLHGLAERESLTRHPKLFYRRPDGTWCSTAEGSSHTALSKHLQELEQIIEDLDIREDQARTADDYYALIDQILPLKRLLANLYLTLDDARKQLPNVRELINFRDHAYDLSRSADLLYEAIQAGSELAHIRQAEKLAMHSQLMEQSAHRLNLLVAFFFPLATLATVFGMNLSFGLDTKNPAIFWLICGIGLAFGVLLVALIFRQKRVRS